MQRVKCNRACLTGILAAHIGFQRERENVYLPLANTSITYSIICLYAVVGCQKGQSPSKLATHCSKQHNNTQ